MPRLLCQPGPHAPAADVLVPGGKAYKLSKAREYWVDDSFVTPDSHWVPVQGAVSPSDATEPEPTPTPSQSNESPPAGAQSVCGALKADGTPCQRSVPEPHYTCWQHNPE